MKYTSISFKNKRSKEYCTIEYNSKESGASVQQVYDVKNIKTTDQPITKELSDLRMNMEAHLMWASEFIDGGIDLDEKLDYETYFKTNQHQHDKRFEGVEVTKIEFVPNKEGELHGVKIYGKKVTQYTDKPFTNPIKTPVIQLNKESDNYYKLVSIIDGQVNDLIIEIGNFLEKAKAVKDSQLRVAI